MSNILVTGASGLIGNALVNRLKNQHNVIAMSRRCPEGEGFTRIDGDFARPEDLSQLDALDIDATIHLGAVTGGCRERDGILVNVEGSRVLMQYVAERGCKKVVLASSIAAIGFQREDFIPDHLPITEEHDCRDRDGYGLSKYLMEVVARYISYQKPNLDILNIRLSTVGTLEQVEEGLRAPGEWCLGAVTYMVVEDAVDLFEKAVESPVKPGLRVVNGVCSRSWSSEPVARQLRHWWGPEADTSYFDRPGNAYASVFDTTRLKKEFGFEATKTLEILNRVQPPPDFQGAP